MPTELSTNHPLFAHPRSVCYFTRSYVITNRAIRLSGRAAHLLVSLL